MDIYENYISPVGQHAIDYAAKGLVVAGAGYLKLAEWETESWQEITTGIINYVTDINNNILESEIPITLLGSSGQIGFTDDSRFSFTLDPELGKNESCQIDFGNSVCNLKFIDKDITQSLYPELDAQPGQSNYARVIELVMPEFKYVWVSHDWSDSRSILAGTYTSQTFDNDYQRGVNIAGGRNISFFSSYWGSGDRCGYYDSIGNFYTVVQKDGKFSFVNYFDGISIFKNLKFDTRAQLLVWLCEQAGFKISISDQVSDPDQYKVKDKTPVITGDPSAAQTKNNSIIDGAPAETGTITTALPTTDELMDVIVANPDIILDPEQAATLDVPIPVKPADLPDIDIGSPQLWTTKFPFCLPFDIYRLIADFSSEPQAPNFHILVMPSNSFGLQNEDIYIDVDFKNYDKIVKILRFFLSISFVFFLIIITRKIIS